jgi:3-dehydroquinate synthase
VSIKADIVNRDEKEAGERRKLNFGHTFGHAIEKTMKTAHGEAVSAGMVLAASLSVRRGLLPQAKAGRLVDLLKKLKLPTSAETNPAGILDALKKDKKREGDSIHFILLEDIGQAVIQEIPIEELEIFLNDI